MNNNDALIVSVCVILPLLILIAVIAVIYFAIERTEEPATPPKVEPISQTTDCCKLHRQYCEMDIILLRYEHIKLLNIDCSDYRLFKMEVDNIFDTPDEKEAFFEKYPSMKQRYQCLEYFLWRVLSHK